MMKCFGDSITAGMSASPGAAYVSLFNPVNAGVPASQAADVSSHVQQEAVSPKKIYTLMVGLNDASRYGADPVKREFYRRCLRAVMAWLKLPEKKTARGGGIAFAGLWSDSPSPNPCGKYTTQQGASASATVSGDSVYVAVSEGDYVGMGESISVVIDGVERGPLSVKVPGVTTWLNQWWGRTCWRFDGLGDGAHTVVVTQNSPTGKFLHLDYIAGSDQSAATPLVVAGTITPCTQAWYNSVGLTSEIIDTYNDVIKGVSAEFGVTLADTAGAIDVLTGLSADGAHPNNIGHAAIHAAFVSAIISSTKK